MPVTAPDWPRMMRKAMAAAYCDLSTASFEREIFDGRLPVGVLFGGQMHWSRVALDEALDRITGHGVADWRSRSGLYGNAA